MIVNRSPRLDNFLYDFFKATWDFFGPNLFIVYKEEVWEKSLGAIIDKGFIEFIPKVGVLELNTI
jgi:hypothetical protein